jgi:hypothetical protein
MHPSWKSKLESSVIKPFEGKKIVFDWNIFIILI